MWCGCLLSRFGNLTLEVTLGFMLSEEWLLGGGAVIHIGEAARLAGVSVDSIRFYQRLGLIRALPRSVGGYRLFGEEEIRDLKFVRHAQELGFSLHEIKELTAIKQKHHVCHEMQSMVKRKLGAVRNKIAGLIRLEAELKTALRTCEREFRSGRQVKHDCCPLVEKLEALQPERG